MKTSALFLPAVALAFAGATACVANDEGDTEDAQDEVGVPDGKADGAFSQCQLDGVVTLLNAGAARADLVASGVGARAAANLVANRDGADKKFGTRDDKPFADIAAVDAVAYVGPKAITALVGMLGSECGTTTLRTGYKQLRPANSGNVYTGIAVDGTTAYLASNDRSIDVVNLKTLSKTKSFTRIAAEALSFDQGKLVACGMRDDAPLGFPEPPTGGMANNYVVSFIDPANGRVDREVILKLQEYLGTSSTDAFIDLPNISCKVSGGRITVGFAQDKLQHEIVSFATPSTSKTFDFRSVPGATRSKVGSPGRNGTISGFTCSAARGYTLAAGGYGIDRVAATGSTTVRQVRAAAPREWFVDIVDQGGATMLAVDLDGQVLSLDAHTGETLAATDVPDMLQAITLDSGYAFVAGRHGVFIQKL